MNKKEILDQYIYENNIFGGGFMEQTPPKVNKSIEVDFYDLDPLINVADILETEEDDMEEEYGNPDENDDYAG